MPKTKRYTKKPIAIEAFVWDGVNPIDGAPMWYDIATSEGTCEIVHTNLVGCEGRTLAMRILTLEGPMYALPQDYIVRGVRGELYSCKPDIFEQTYEELL